MAKILRMALAGMALLACGQTGEGMRPSWRVPDGDAARGAALAAPCLACHGAAALAPKLTRQRQSALFFALIDYREGRRSDPVMGPMAAGLSDQDARDLAAALAGELLAAPPDPHTSHPAYARAAQTCLFCHGETGIGEFEGMPVLTGQDAAYLARALAAYRDGGRTDPTMRAVAAGLSDAEIAGLADYYAGHAWLERGR